MKGLIVGSGEIENHELLKEVVEKVDYVICADGGANYLIKIGLMPDLVVGDLDSIEKETLEILKEKKIKIIKHSEEKDYTDTELSIQYLVDKKVKEIILMGVIGSRLDHTLANVFLLNNLLDIGIESRIISDKNLVYITNEKLVLEKMKNSFVSIIPINSEGAILTLKGFKYETKKEKFSFSSSYGISNEIVEEKGIIEVYKGNCLVIVSKD